VTVRLLLDNSAWARLAAPSLEADRAEEVAAAIEGGEVATCLPFLLEAGYSARSANDHEGLIGELLSLPLLSIDERIERRALNAQHQLAQVGHHRLPPVDLILAAIAEQYEVGVLHYDQDFDLLLEKTDLSFESVWLAPRGSL
jgi:predicted nucleic acid-binding protein